MRAQNGWLAGWMIAAALIVGCQNPGAGGGAGGDVGTTAGGSEEAGAAEKQRADRPPEPPPLPAAPFEPAEAPQPSGRLEEAPEADELAGAVASYFEDRPGQRVYLQTDRPLYRPGETIWVKSWNLQARDLSGIQDNKGVVIELVSPKGDVVTKKRVRERGGHAAIDFELAEGLSGGRYRLRLRQYGGGSEVKAQRPVVVSSYEAPRIKKELEFMRKAYGEGDQVVATVKVKRGTGQPLKGREISGQVRVDGRRVETVKATTNPEGGAVLRFELPADIETGDGILTVLVGDGGVTESISRRIPIVLDAVDVDFYPEGGQMVAGLPTRVYFDADKMDGKPADVAGKIVDDQGQLVTRFRSYKNGMGRFRFTPEPGRSYRAELVKPEGVDGSIELPDVAESGCVMEHFDDFEGRLRATRVAVRCTESREVVVSAFMRNNPLDVAAVEVPEGGEAVVYLEPQNAALAGWQGVARVTLFDAALTPLAERLVYRRWKERLKISVEPERESYGPRDRVKLRVRTTGPSGEARAARLAMSVVDDKVISFAQDGGGGDVGHLLSSLLLEPELPGEIEKPNFYLNRDKPKAARAMDMLMGTRGWRRFRWKRVLGGPEEEKRAEEKRAEGAEETSEESSADEEEAFAEEESAPDLDRLGDRLRKQGPAKEGKAKPRPLQEQQARGQMARVAEEPAPADRANKQVRARRVQPRGGGGKVADGLVVLNDRAGEAELDAFGGRGFGGLQAKRKRRRWAKVREFPVPDYAGQQGGDHVGPRDDFRDTVYWNPEIDTGADGEATVEFYLSDAITSFRVMTEGVGAGLPGRGETVFKSTLPFGMTAKLPLQVSAGDRLKIPVTLMNERDEAIEVDLRASFGDLLKRVGGPATHTTVKLGPEERISRFFEVEVTGTRGDSQVQLEAEAAGLSDSVQRSIEVAPRGFPRGAVAGGEFDERVEEELNIGEAVPGTRVATVKVFPSPVSTMTEGLAGMLRTPRGCFEQASSSNYPNVMLVSYLEEQGLAAPEVASRAKRLMDKGYRKLVGYETRQDGYEWFGKAPGHEALTAYGLLEFVQMKEVYGGVSQAMIERTARWLMSRRDGEGGYEENPRALDSFGRASETVTDAYITYALTEAGYAGRLETEVNAQVEVARTNDDPYVLALAANTLLNAGRGGPAKTAIGRLAEMQSDDGSWKTADHSITRSRGRNLHTETTALATMALMERGGRRSEVRGAVTWLNGQRDAMGKWGATQATVLTLQTLTRYARKRKAEAGPGRVKVIVDGEVVSEKGYSATQSEPLSFDVSAYLSEESGGEHTVELVRTEGAGTPMPYNIAIDYRSERPRTSPEAGVRLKTELATSTLKMGETARLTATVENVEDGGLGMVLARVALPGGLTFQQWQLKELQEQGRVAFIETREREVHLYFREMEPGEVKRVPLELKGAFAGRYRGQASRAYLYYNDNHIHWSDPLTVSVER